MLNEPIFEMECFPDVDPSDPNGGVLRGVQYYKHATTANCVINNEAWHFSLWGKGWMKSVFTPRATAKLGKDVPGKFGPISRAEALRRTNGVPAPGDEQRGERMAASLQDFASDIESDGVDAAIAKRPNSTQPTSPDPVAAVEQAINSFETVHGYFTGNAISRSYASDSAQATYEYLQSAIPAIRKLQEDLATERHDNGELRADLESARHDAEASQNKAAEWGERVEALEAERNKWRGQAGEWSARYGKASTRRAKWQAKYNTMKADLDRVTAQRDNARNRLVGFGDALAERDRLKAELEEAQKEGAQHAKYHLDAQAKLRGTGAKLESAERALASVRRELGERTTEADNLRGQLQKMHDDWRRECGKMHEVCVKQDATLAEQRGLLEECKATAEAGFIGKLLYDEIAAHLRSEPGEAREGAAEFVEVWSARQPIPDAIQNAKHALMHLEQGEPEHAVSPLFAAMNYAEVAKQQRLLAQPPAEQASEERIPSGRVPEIESAYGEAMPAPAEPGVRWYACRGGNVVVRKPDGSSLVVLRDGRVEHHEHPWSYSDCDTHVANGDWREVGFQAALAHIGDNQAARLAMWRESGEPLPVWTTQKNEEGAHQVVALDHVVHHKGADDAFHWAAAVTAAILDAIRSGHRSIITKSEADALIGGGG